MSSWNVAGFSECRPAAGGASRFLPLSEVDDRLSLAATKALIEWFEAMKGSCVAGV